MEYPSYTYPVSSLRAGSSLGNFYTFARLSADTDLKGLWSAIDDQYYLGEWNIDLFIDGIKLEAHSTEFNPESQETRYGEGNIDVRKRLRESIERPALRLGKTRERSCSATPCGGRHSTRTGRSWAGR